MPIICLLGLLLLLLLLLLVLETLSILVIGSWIPHARSTGARRALRWSAHLEAVLLSLCWSAHLGAVHLVCLLGLLVLLLLLLVLETLSILVIGCWIPHARSTGARRALHWSATRAPLERAS